MKRKIIAAIQLIALALSLFACSTQRVISGQITAINSDTIHVAGKMFTADTSGLYVGKFVSFTPTVVRSKINSKKLTFKK